VLRALAIIGLVLLGGCASPPLPTYEPMDAQRALATIADRLQAVHTVFGTARIALEDGHGGSIRLDGALAAEFPDRIRLRAWKFNTAVFDVTAVGDEAWVLASDRMSPEQSKAIPAGGVRTARDLLGPAFFRHASEAPGSTAALLIVEGPLRGGGSATCEIDRATLTPRVFRAGEATLVLDRYRVTQGTPWAWRWTLTSPQGTVAVRLDDVVLGGGVAPGAFTPPARATKVAP
jgi:hypothetical protein